MAQAMAMVLAPSSRAMDMVRAMVGVDMAAAAITTEVTIVATA